MPSIHDLLSALSQQRPVFHSEADFQFALAWAWQQADPDAAIRLEYRLPGEGTRDYADLWIRESAESRYFELKYWTRPFDAEVNGERFVLTNQGAHDLSRYDFVKDLGRVGRTIQSGYASSGGVIAITNDPAYWNESNRSTPTIDAAFRLDEGRVLTGELAWAATAGGTIRKRERSIYLIGLHECHWQPYSRGGEFRYLYVPVGDGAHRT